MKQFTRWVILVLLFAWVSGAVAEDKGEPLPRVPTEGMVTMVDLGAHKCIPCKMMAPVLKKLKKQYEAKASIVFIDVWQHREQAQRHAIRTIPTQIFFDKEGEEVYRHEGFMSEEAIIGQLAKMGVDRLAKNDVKDALENITR
ncbi:MAG: thioredoxin family protein [Thermodesulfobacteriota bacterium]|nr:thioredoxin family protein [Thermodesulfobacteriota bacterium]